VPTVFLGVDAEKFHNGITKYVNMTSDAVDHAYDATKNFVKTRWYMTALPIALTFGVGIYELLMSVKPEAEVHEASGKKRKKNMMDYFMKYKGQTEKMFQNLTNSDLNGTLDDKVTEETKK
jgi:hypothetical protein